MFSVSSVGLLGVNIFSSLSKNENENHRTFLASIRSDLENIFIYASLSRGD